MTVLWTEFPQLDEQLEEDQDGGECFQCDCGTLLSFCGTFQMTLEISDWEDQGEICRDCWSLYEQGWLCSWCGRFYKA